jgi:hypothetical protein
MASDLPRPKDSMVELVVVVKVVASVALVLALSLVAEYVSPKAAGMLAGYPLGAAIALFFVGLEIGPEYAGHSAVYTMMGLVATQAFVYCYFKANLVFRDYRYSILLSSTAAMGGYAIVVWLLHFIPRNTILAICIPIASIFAFVHLFKEIQNVGIRQRVKLSKRVLLFRAVVAAVTILVITGIARSVGSAWTGLFSAFPITLFPLILIVHITYDMEHVHTIIKNFPLGLGSLIAYSLTVSLAYPRMGIYVGTLLGFTVATAYLLVFRFVRERMGR